MPIITRIAILSSNCRTINSIPARSLKIFYPPSIDNVFLAISIRNRRLSAPQRTRKSYITILQVCISFPPPWPVSFIHSPPPPSFRYRLQSTAFFPISFFPPSPFPRYFVSRCFVKGPLLYFSRWLASTDYLAGCHLELRIPDNSFPLMVLYEERLFPPLPSPSPYPGFTNDYRWKFLENWNLEVLHFLTSKNLFEFIPI